MKEAITVNVGIVPVEEGEYQLIYKCVVDKHSIQIGSEGVSVARYYPDQKAIEKEYSSPSHRSKYRVLPVFERDFVKIMVDGQLEATYRMRHLNLTQEMNSGNVNLSQSLYNKAIAVDAKKEEVEWN